ncbi:MAG: hypothetical protein FJY25_11920 [Betaproteobacteria bacterium]|nr:hypothetical protein [Betaproteobacteria bacterium]
MALGFLLGGVLGFSGEFLLGRSPILSWLFDPFITAIYCMPKIALASLLIMWFGIGIASNIVIAALIVFFFVFLDTFEGGAIFDRTTWVRFASWGSGAGKSFRM